MIRHGKFNKFKHPISWNFGCVEGYQFAGTGDVRYQDFLDPITGIADRYWPRLNHVLVRPLTKNDYPVDRDGKKLAPGAELEIDAIPMISNFDAGEVVIDKVVYKWDYVPDLTDIHNFLGKPPRKLKGWLLNQPDGADVKYWYGIKANPFLITTWSQGQSLPTAFFPRSSGTFIDHVLFLDNGFDFPPTSFTVSEDPLRHKAYRPMDSDWYRHGAYVEKEFMFEDKLIKRTFIICHDIEHRFYAFPIAARNLELEEGVFPKWGTVNRKYVRTFEVPWPGYIDPATIGKDYPAQQRPDWYFSHNGKYAVSLPVVIDEPWSGGGITSKKLLINTSVTDIKESYPALVEIEFNLDIYGINLEDFSFELTLKQDINPQETGRSIVSAQYAVKDFPDEGIKADDLIILEYEMYISDVVVDTLDFYPIAIYKTGVESGTCDGTDIKRDCGIYYRYNSVNEKYPPYDPALGSWTSGDGSYYNPFVDFTKINELYLPAGKSLRRPNIATVALIKKLSDDSVIKSFLVNYEGLQVHKLKHTHWYDDDAQLQKNADMQVHLDEHKKFNDLSLDFDAWFDYGDPPLGYGEPLHTYCTIGYTVNIQSMELSTLSYLLTATISAVGNHSFLDISSGAYEIKVKTESIAGSLQVLTVFGKEESSQYGGYALLETQLRKLYYVEEPNLNNYHKIDLTAIVSGSPAQTTDFTFSYDYYIFNPQPSGPFMNDCVLATYNVNALINLGPAETYYNSSFMTESSIFVIKDTLQYNGSGMTTFGKARKNLAKADIQELIINYGVDKGTDSYNKVFGCTRIQKFPSFKYNTQTYQYDSIFTEKTDNVYYMELFSNTNERSIIYTPKIFSFFDASFYSKRPGTVHSWANVEIRTETNPNTFNPTGPGSSFFTYIYSDETIMEGSFDYTDYPLGKVYFNRVLSLTLNALNNVQSQIRTHPNGSWAVFCSNTLTPKEKYDLTYGIAGFETTTNVGNTTFDKSSLDHIHIVYQDKDLNTFTKDTTHIDMLNSAFYADLSMQDYEFEITSQPVVYTKFNDKIIRTTTGWFMLDLENGQGLTTGGLTVTKKWENPNLDNVAQLNPSLQNEIHGFDIAKTLGVDFLYAHQTPLCFNDGLDISTYYSCINDICLTTNKQITGILNQYCTTPRMESIFYFKNPYIDRDENKP